MTLCAVWKRQSEESEELVFVTDSRLTGGITWDTGVKLFGLPRQDCIICFSGETDRAYPLVLHLIESIRSSLRLLDRHVDIHIIVEHITNLFTELCNELRDPPHSKTLDDLKEAAQFLFGGWSWKTQKLCCWKVYYSRELQVFTMESLHDLPRFIEFLGDYTDEAWDRLEAILGHLGAFRSDVDLEPLKVVFEMSADREFREIGGSLQVAKIYPSGTTEFFGEIWRDNNDKCFFLGREVKMEDAPNLRFIDPSTFWVGTYHNLILEKQQEQQGEQVVETDMEEALVEQY